MRTLSLARQGSKTAKVKPENSKQVNLASPSKQIILAFFVAMLSFSSLTAQLVSGSGTPGGSEPTGCSTYTSPPTIWGGNEFLECDYTTLGSINAHPIYFMTDSLIRLRIGSTEAVGVNGADNYSSFSVKNAMNFAYVFRMEASTQSNKPTLQMLSSGNVELLNAAFTLKENGGGIKFQVNSAGHTMMQEGQVNNNLNVDGNETLGGDLKVDGGVGIGTTCIPVDYKLAVEGKIGAREVKVNADSWCDYVFDEDYKLLSLGDLENYIKKNKHLPEIPTTKEVTEKGVLLGEMQTKLLKKVEELTLYTIELKKEIEQLKKQINSK